MPEGLDSILRTTTESRARAGEVLVTIDRNNGNVVRREGFLERMAAAVKKTTTYAVKIETWAEIYDIDQMLKIFVTREDTKIRFRLRVYARSTRAEQIASRLSDPVLSPTEVLFRVVGEAIGTLSDESQREGPDNLARRIARDRTNWQNRIQQSIADRIGLDAEIIFELGPIVLELPEISVRQFEVRAKDSPNRVVPVSVTVVLEPTEERAHDPLPKSDRDREDRVRMAVASAFRDEVSLYDYWFARGKVESILAQAIDRVFRTSAHRTRSVQLAPVSPPFLHEEKVSCNVEWKGNAGRVIDFYVEAVLSFLPDGAGLYDSLHLPPRVSWLKEHATQALEIAMHGRDFWDLALADQAEVSARVASILRQAAEKTGQKIDPLLAKVILPENRWLDKQYLELAGESFKTKNELGTAEFDISIDIQFRTIRPLVDFVRHHRDDLGTGNGKDFNVEIEKAILGVVRKTTIAVMSQIEHSDYFARWEEWNHVGEVIPGTQKGETNYVHHRLVLAIQAELRSRFDPTLCTVRLRKVDKAVAAIWRCVMELGPMEVSFDVRPRVLTPETGLIPVTVRFRPGYLDPSKVPDLIARGPKLLDRAAIFDTLTSAARRFFEGRPAEEIRAINLGRGASFGSGNALQADLEEEVCRDMIKVYGFTVMVEDARVGITASEKAYLAAKSLETIALQSEVDHRREQIAADYARIKTQREKNKALADKLHRALMDNPRQSDADLNRYEIDERQLQRTETKLTEDDRSLATLMNESIKSGYSLAPPSSVAPSERPSGGGGAAPRPDDDILDRDGNIVPRDPEDVDRL